MNEWQKFNESVRQSRAVADAKQRAADQATSDGFRQQRMRSYEQAGRAAREAASNFSSSSSRQETSMGGYSGSSGKAKSNNSGLAIIILGVVGFFAYKSVSGPSNAPSNSSATSAPSSPTPAPIYRVPPPEPRPSAAVPEAPVVEPVRTPLFAAPETAASPVAAPSSEPAPVAVPTPAPTPKLEVKNRVSPVYPQLARQSNMGGSIEVYVGVAPDGTVVSAFAAKGNPILTDAAIKAAKQWVFYPYEAESGSPLRTTSINFHFEPNS